MSRDRPLRLVPSAPRRGRRRSLPALPARTRSPRWRTCAGEPTAAP